MSDNQVKESDIKTDGRETDGKSGYNRNESPPFTSYSWSSIYIWRRDAG